MTSNNPRQNQKSSKPDQNASGGSVALLLLTAGVAIAAVIPFISALGNAFVNWDDYETLVDNPRYRGFGWPQLRWMFTTFHLGHYQPLSWLTFSLDYSIWGMNPAGYHLTNLILHAANATLVFFLARSLLSRVFRCAVDARGCWPGAVRLNWPSTIFARPCD